MIILHIYIYMGLCVCKAINMIEGCLPASNQEQPKNIVLSSYRTDADNSVCPVADFGGTIPYSSPQKVMFKDLLSIDTCHVVSVNTQQDLTKCTYCSYDDTNVSGINLTSSVIPDNSSNMSLADKNCDTPSSSTDTSDKPVDTVRPKDAKACRRFRKLFRKRIHRNKGHLKSVSNHAPMNFSNADLTPATISLLSKGPSFVPTPKHIDWGKLSKDFLKFKNKMRWRAKYGNQEAEKYEDDSDEEIFRCFKLPSGNDAPRSDDQALELFLELIENDIFHPDLAKTKYRSNLSIYERKELYSLQDNKDLAVRIQDKGSRFVVANTNEYTEKMDKYFSDNPSFTCLDSDLTKDIISKVSNWAEKWLEVGEINADVMEYVLNFKAQPAKNYGLIKTHKPGRKLRVITAGTNSAIAQLSAFTERFLGPIARSLRYILVDTTDFLRMLQDINKRFGPIPDHFLLASWDIVAMYPSINNALGMEACRKALDKREKLKPSTDCIMGAIELTLENNNSTFNGKHYLHTDGTAMGPKNACSYADISVSEIDNKVFEHEYLQPLCWGRYRDDCFGLWNGSLKELRVFTSYLSSISPSIKFTVQYNCYQLEFLDVLVKKENGLLETTVYSKKSDGHMYLLPSSCHFHTVFENIPYGVALRLKRICSTETEFNMKSDEYQTHLIARAIARKESGNSFIKQVSFQGRLHLPKPRRITITIKLYLI